MKTQTCLEIITENKTKTNGRNHLKKAGVTCRRRTQRCDWSIETIKDTTNSAMTPAYQNGQDSLQFGQIEVEPWYSA